ncbi:hypothetical protein OJF2_60030 [Aquisphaera giovannonii]|uniref:Methyltransferase domain protein n=1 Tax=Aquisphaera giovannonii TaxID=406548 RepID=A0A5B9WA15_9BACT|nr:methyltransferase domain-containing protein [Aquisphaera giovannonii]QEH37412.1 hypothetical protein OJF2_60030 [Aquisphaera giovannonii]
MLYDDEFYASQSGGSLRSAKAVVPYVVSLLAPKSVVDVGCGVGTWLSVFREQGVERVLGVDGDYVKADSLLIPADRFLPRDLSRSIGVGERFDLATSLEVAEHLPPDSGPHFVDELVKLADAVLFSAAIPEQGGVNHTNERWQSYWRELFAERGFLPVDCIRPQFWTDPRVMAFYSQNILLYVKKEVLDQRPDLKALADGAAIIPFDVVHPEQYRAGLANQRAVDSGLRTMLSRLPKAAVKTARRYLVRQ